MSLAETDPFPSLDSSKFPQLSKSSSLNESSVIESSEIKPITRQKLYLKSEIQEISFSHQWNIENVSFYCLTENGPNRYSSLYSSSFSSPSNDKLQFRLELYPNGKDENSIDNLSLCLHLDKSHRNKIALEVNFGIIDSDRCVTNTQSAKTIFNPENYNYSSVVAEKFCTHELILDSSSKLAPGDVLTIFCNIRYDEVIDEVLDDPLTVAMTELENDFGRLINESGNLTDVVLVFGDEKKRAEFAVHAAILGARSEVFAAMFEHDMQEKNKRRVEITDVNAEMGEALVNYLYGGKPNVDKNAERLLPIADKYQLHSLKSICEGVLCFRLNSASVCNLLLLADMHNSVVLKSKCIEYIHWYSN